MKFIDKIEKIGFKYFGSVQSFETGCLQDCYMYETKLNNRRCQVKILINNSDINLRVEVFDSDDCTHGVEILNFRLRNLNSITKVFKFLKQIDRYGKSSSQK